MTALAPSSIPEIEAAPCDDLIAAIRAGGWLTEYEEMPPRSGDSYNSFCRRNKFLCGIYRPRTAREPTPAQQAARERANRERLAVYDLRQTEGRRRAVLRHWPTMFAKDQIVWITTLETHCHIKGDFNGDEFEINFEPRQHFLVPMRVAELLINGNRAKMRQPKVKP